MSDVEAYRIFKAVHAATAMTGEGAKRYGGRWNSPGTAVVYCSSSLALAQLETLVHLQSVSPPQTYEFIKLIIPSACEIQTVAPEDLQELYDWRAWPAPAVLQEMGNDWLAEARFPVLKVPSAVSPAEFNYLLNPAHPEFSRIVPSEPQALNWDERLLRRFDS